MDPLPKPAPDAPPATRARLAIDYRSDRPDALLADPDTLAVLGFGAAAPVLDDPRYLRIPLEPHGAAAPLEAWRGAGPVARGRDDGAQWAEDGALQFGAIELDEGAGGIEAAAAEAYARLSALLLRRGYPHLLRTWTHLDALTSGDGDDERYRRFCVGRVRGLGAVDPADLPAATVIGRQDGVRRLQLYWLAARAPGTPLENPRQVSAFRYPRQYGPQAPTFVRAMLPPAGAAMPLLLSGTASIVGHESRHADSATAQLDEIFANLASLLDAARAVRPDLPPTFDASSRLKVYVRDAALLPAIADALAARLGDVPRLLLHAAVCRRELRVEIDGVHGMSEE